MCILILWNCYLPSRAHFELFHDHLVTTSPSLAKTWRPTERVNAQHEFLLSSSACHNKLIGMGEGRRSHWDEHLDVVPPNCTHAQTWSSAFRRSMIMDACIRGRPSCQRAPQQPRLLPAGVTWSCARGTLQKGRSCQQK
jgi:hypothetical protein